MEEHKAPKTFSFPDDPLARHEGLKVDREVGSEGQSLADLRLTALEHARAMPISGEGKWVQLGPTAIPKVQTYGGARVLVTGRITSIVVDPTNSNTLYVGAAQGGVWKTTDQGKTWRPTSDNEFSLAIGALAIDPKHPQTLYAGTGEGNFAIDSYYGSGILKTTDGGDTWEQLGSGLFTGVRFCRLAIHPTTPTILFAATTAGRDGDPNPLFKGGLYRSMNGGTTWTQMTNGLPSISATVRGATDIVIDPNTPDTAYVAFWAGGVYRTSNAKAASPTWTKLTNGLPIGNFSRIALGVAPSSPQTLYALIADAARPNYYINQFYRTTDGGNSWSAILLPLDPTSRANNIDKQGFYNLNVAVDPTTPDIVYLSGISLWKATRNTITDTWVFADIGGSFHPDNHSFAFDPTNHQIIYAGSDGGIYTSIDAGATWSDAINRGLCITQCEFMEQHPTSDAVIFIGTQDNGTEQFRNSPVFYHADGGDGGFVAIDQTNPQNVLSTYNGLSPKLSTTGGAYGSWIPVSRCLFGNAVFYPPLALDQSHQKNCAIGSDRIFLDTAQGTGGWPTIVTLPGLAVKEGERISAINYTNSKLIYVGTELGKVYRLTNSEGTWTATALHATPLPERRYIWDLAPLPDDSNTVVVVMSGFGTADHLLSHVWRGTVPASGTAEWKWTNISGTESGPLPDIPVNALVLDTREVMYIATDLGVFSTRDGGTTWTNFSQGLPNCAVFDMRLHQPTRLLRVATHGRGVWERQLDAFTPDVDTFVRDHLMQTGRRPSSSTESAAFADPLQHVALGDPMWWWQCADIKIDALEGSVPAYQMNVDEVDYIAFESRLEHRNSQPGRVNRVYVQLHNRGVRAARDVTVKVFYTDATAGLPDLPADFWTAFPADSAQKSPWKPIGRAQTIPLLSPTEPVILEWGWNTPVTPTDHFCYLVVMDCPSDPIPEANKVLQVATLIVNEKHAGLKNVHLVNLTPGKLGTIYWTPFRFFGNPDLHYNITIPPSQGNGWSLALMFPLGTPGDLKLEGIIRDGATPAELAALTSKIGADGELYDTTRLYKVENLAMGARIAGVSLPVDGPLQAMVMLIPPPEDVVDTSISIVQKIEETVVGGSTFALHLVNR